MARHRKAYKSFEPDGSVASTEPDRKIIMAVDLYEPLLSQDTSSNNRIVVQLILALLGHRLEKFS